MPYDHAKRPASVTAVLAAILLTSACTGGTPSPVVGTAVAQALKRATPVAPQIVTADNTFGLALLNALNRGATSNVAISPTSIALALQMVYDGAEGSTRQGMTRALQLQGLGALAVDELNAALQAALINPDPKAQLRMANSLWMHLRENSVLPSFASTNENYYAAKIGDLSGAPDDVNAWVARETEGLIKKILPPRDYSRVAAVLANTIYFRGAWTSVFNPKLTMAAPFTLSDGSEVSCRMMKMNRPGRFSYLSVPDFQAVELPYGSTRRLRMLIILPAVGVNLSSFVSNMTSEELRTWIADLEPAEVSIGLPRFTTTYASSLVDALTSLGMGAAFSRANADFAGLVSRGGFYISDVEHEAVVRVDERGTVAAGATAAQLELEAIGPPSVSMTMNRPFFYAIVDGKTGALLFIGTLVDPTPS
ncbi:MAG TPA: serpin family protein [Steroidobacteraceae bacterium]|nr:serpin family protein [Steroidobacteraceae bacterium]